MFLILEDDQEIHWFPGTRIFRKRYKSQLLEPVTRELSPDPSIQIEFHVTFLPNFISELTYSIQFLS